MALYLALTPRDRAPSSVSIAHVAFRLNGEGTLLSCPLPPQVQRGLLVLTWEEPFPPEAAGHLARQLTHLCRTRPFGGVVLDGDVCDGATALCRALEQPLLSCKRRLYAPLPCIRSTRYARGLLCTAISGGALRAYLQEAVRTWGKERLALDVQRLSMVFPLPCPTGQGTPLPPGQLQEQIRGCPTYYSDALCARYCTLRQGGETRFCLFDDAETIRRKIRLGRELGIEDAFLQWPEVADIWPELAQKERS